MVCETGETGENALFYCAFLLLSSTKRSLLTGLTGLPPFPLYLQEWDFEAGPKKLTHSDA
jgi:hypothetical protein